VKEEGVVFRTGVYVGRNLAVDVLRSEFDVILLCIGSTIPRDLPVPGRELKGVHYAMEYLPQQNKVLAGETFSEDERISAEGKRVVIIGGGDTGADCLATAHRQGAEIVRQFEIVAEPPGRRNPGNPWPQWPLILRRSYALEEGGSIDYSISVKNFEGRNGQLEKLNTIRLDWKPGEDGRMQMIEVPGTEQVFDADLVLLAMGFLHPEKAGMVEQLGVELDPRGNVKTDANKMTNVPGIFAAGDASRGQSLVVWAMSEGREAARGVDLYLMGETELPRSLSNV
jgi:glutamate synthase (NADPH/NADH) small chain